MQINGINAGQGLRPTAVQPQATGNFAAKLNRYIEQVNLEHKQAALAAESLAEGKGGSLSETLMAIEQADLSAQMLLAVRNKLVEAYHEVMRMQV